MDFIVFRFCTCYGSNLHDKNAIVVAFWNKKYNKMMNYNKYSYIQEKL